MIISTRRVTPVALDRSVNSSDPWPVLVSIFVFVGTILHRPTSHKRLAASNARAVYVDTSVIVNIRESERMSKDNQNWDARREHAIREGWPSAHGRKPQRTPDERRDAARIRMAALRRSRRLAKDAAN